MIFEYNKNIPFTFKDKRFCTTDSNSVEKHLDFNSLQNSYLQCKNKIKNEIIKILSNNFYRRLDFKLNAFDKYKFHVDNNHISHFLDTIELNEENKIIIHFRKLYDKYKKEFDELCMEDAISLYKALKHDSVGTFYLLNYKVGNDDEIYSCFAYSYSEAVESANALREQYERIRIKIFVYNNLKPFQEGGKNKFYYNEIRDNNLLTHSLYYCPLCEDENETIECKTFLF